MFQDVSTFCIMSRVSESGKTTDSLDVCYHYRRPRHVDTLALDHLHAYPHPFIHAYMHACSYLNRHARTGGCFAAM